MKKNIILNLGLIPLFCFSAFAQISSFSDSNIVEGLGVERENSVYWEKWNLKLAEAPQFILKLDLEMQTVKSSVNKVYFYHRDLECEVSGPAVANNKKILAKTNYALVDYGFNNKNEISLLIYAVDSKTDHQSLDIVCQNVNRSVKIKDLQHKLQKIFLIKEGAKPKKWFGLF